MPPHRLLNALYLIYVRSLDPRRVEGVDDELAAWPIGIPRLVTTNGEVRRGRRPRNWGDGDDDQIERDAGLAALAGLRGMAPRRH